MKQRQLFSFLLCTPLLLGLLCGCSSQDSALSPTPALSDCLEQVRDLGIADLDVLRRADEPCTQAETANMLSRVLELQRGVTSQYLADPGVVTEGEPTTRHYFAQALYFSLLETFYDEPYEDWEQWTEYCAQKDAQQSEELRLAQQPDAQLIGQKLDGTVGAGGFWEFFPDHTENEIPPDEETSRYYIDFGFSPAFNYAVLLYDRTDGSRVLEPDENMNIRPFETMTVAEVAEAALRYYNSFEPLPQMVPYADTASFDAAIITPQLLEKESTLPDASCASLPSEWRGALLGDWGIVCHQALDNKPDKCMFEYEIQSLQDAGLNFIGLSFDFSYLQGPVLQEGTLNETRLKQLDQVIAWCMERDIHVDLRCSGVGGLDVDDSFGVWAQRNKEIPNGTDYAPEFAALWKALAQRYADIPNRYLSFNLLIEPEISSDAQYAAFFGPAVEAIREITPNRCIIADIHSPGLTGKSMAEMGVALSFHEYTPREFCVLDAHLQDDADYLQSVTWPFTASDGITYDAEAVLNVSLPDGVNANQLAATAKEYGVGFMVGEFGIFVGDGSYGLPRNRYSDQTISAFFQDMTTAMEKQGYSWCLGTWDGTYGAVSYYPSVETASYEQVEDHPYYIDRFMFDLVQDLTAES